MKWVIKVPIIGISAGWFAGAIWILPDKLALVFFGLSFLTMQGLWLE